MAKQASRPAHELPAVYSETYPAQEEIAALAYARWQEKGCPDGAHQEHWLWAEHELITNREVPVQAPRS
jgi:hypothetical protein